MTIQFADFHRDLAQRLTGPGGLYNLGNALGLVGGLSFHLAARMDQGGSASGLAAVAEYFAGSLGALLISLAMLIFFWSGERYHRAWAHGAPPDARLNRIGDISSGWGALVLGAGLFLLGQPVLAATSGLLHAAGKFGSTLPREVQAALPFGPSAFRGVVVASRLPAMAAVLMQARDSWTGASGQPLAAAALLMVCYLLWLKADVALLKG